MSIVSVLGKSIARIERPQQKEKMELDLKSYGMGHGVYFLQLETESGVLTRKFIYSRQ